MSDSAKPIPHSPAPQQISSPLDLGDCAAPARAAFPLPRPHGDGAAALRWLQARADWTARRALRVVAEAGLEVPVALTPRALTDALYGTADAATCPPCGVPGPGDFCRSCGFC